MEHDHIPDKMGHGHINTPSLGLHEYTYTNTSSLGYTNTHLSLGSMYKFTSLWVYIYIYLLLHLVAAETEGRRHHTSKSFHHQLKYHNKQPLVGELHSCDDHVIIMGLHIASWTI